MKTTDDLEKALKTTGSIDNYLGENEESIICENLPELLKEQLEKSGLQKADVINAAEISYVYGCQMFSGAKTSPSRNKLLSVLIAMKLNSEEINAFLKCAGYPFLYAKNKRDSIIMYCIEKKMPVSEINCELYRLGEETL